MGDINAAELVQRLGSSEDSVRKMAVFKLQSVIGDPSFADVFLLEEGLPKLAYLTLTAHGNTLAYALTSFSRLLELDKGWEFVSGDLIERAVQLVVTQPLVNILRSAVSVLVAIVSHPQLSLSSSEPGNFGFNALKPAVGIYPQFLEMLVSMLNSAEHLLCANALHLINSLIRDAVTNDEDTEWPKFIKKLQDLGVIKAVYFLMQGNAIQDLAPPLLEFQSLTKVMLRKWREVKVELEKNDHKRALRSISAASYQEESMRSMGSRRHKDTERWRRVGFETEFPGSEFDDTGFLGMMDLTDYVMKNEDQFRKLVLEQSTKLEDLRVPIARASLAVTLVLYEHFDIEKGEADDAHRYAIMESRNNFEKAFRPLLLHWSRLHTAGLNAFLRLWKATGAEVDDFDKVAELVRILVEQVVGQAPRTRDISEAEVELQDFDYHKLRELQMELLELAYEDVWGHHLRQVRDELNHEALQFVKEQRVRCLLAGAWFPHTVSFADSGPVTKQTINRSLSSNWRFVRLSHNRRYLHYADFETIKEPDPGLDDLSEKLDLSAVSSVVSNVSASPPSSSSSTTTLQNTAKSAPPVKPAISPASTKITIHGYLPRTTNSTGEEKEQILLQLLPTTHTLASEWLDGLLMLLDQQPITAETNKLVNLIGGYGLKIRLLNVRFDEGEAGVGRGVIMPSREGLDESYYYDIGGMDQA
ncbi:putative elmo ced-12 family protein [Venturia nashicola]|nr:putative elmo ced-12 family protein [Venturia nashicola]